MRVEDARPKAAVYIFGAKVINGSIKGTNTQSRCLTGYALACDLADMGYEVLIAVSGGRDHAGQEIPTGLLMATELEAMDRLFPVAIGQTAMHTHANIWELRQLSKLRGYWRRTTKYVVSEKYHTWRIWLSFLLMYLAWVNRYATQDVLTSRQRLVEHMNFCIHAVDMRGWVFPPAMAAWRRYKAKK